MNNNGHNRYHETNSSRGINNPSLYGQQQREATRSTAIGEMMERARLTAMNTNNSRSQSPTVGNTGMSSQFMDAIQRSDQIPIVDNQSSSSPRDTIVSPSSSSHHYSQSRQNRPARHYPSTTNS